MSKKLKSISIFILTAVLFIMVFCCMNYQKAFAYSGISNTLTEQELYNATNTYNINDSCFEDDEFKITAVDVPENSIVARYNPEQYNISYNMSQKNSNQVMDSTQITVLTHGLGNDASAWSNNFSKTNDKNTPVDFAYDSQSLINMISDKVGDANIYWAKMSGYKSFNLYDISNQKTSGAVYTTTNVINYISDISKHIIIVFDAFYPLNSNNNIYYQFIGRGGKL